MNLNFTLLLAGFFFLTVWHRKKKKKSLTSLTSLSSSTSLTSASTSSTDGGDGNILFETFMKNWSKVITKQDLCKDNVTCQGCELNS